MPMNYDHLMSLATEGERHEYSDRETILYALGVGMGRDPLGEAELDYVYERGALKTVPTLASVLTRSALLRDSGFDYSKVLHGEQRLALHRPLPPSGQLIADSRVVAAYDKGPDKGAVILTETSVRSVADGAPLFTVGSTVFARGDGGFGGPAGSGPEPHRLPERAPDLVVALETRPDQALLYRLSGDRNPLHADPALARRVGFPAPILHGLCTYGTACRAVLQSVCGYDHTRITGFDVRFSSPVYPGETIATEIWVDGKIVSFRCRVAARDVTVINNGKCTLQ
jgi:acyl dehydratase